MVVSPSDNHDATNPSMDWQLLSEINLPSHPGADQLAVELVSRIIEDLHLPLGRLEQLKQAVAVATSNAAKKGNFSGVRLSLSIRVLTSRQLMDIQSNHATSITDSFQQSTTPLQNSATKKESLRSWGFFLIEKTIDDATFNQEGTRQRIELYIYLEGGRNAPRKD